MERTCRNGLAMLAVLVVAGCVTSMPPANFSVPNVGISEHRLDAEVRSITVTYGRPDEQIGQIDFFVFGEGSNVSIAWKTALEEALNRMLLFTDGGSKTVSISVKILKLYVPIFGISPTAKSVARYEIIDRANGDIIFSQDVSSSGTTPLTYAWDQAVLVRESVNRAVQNNIALFLQAAETIDLAKPMFPAGRS